MQGNVPGQMKESGFESSILDENVPPILPSNQSRCTSIVEDDLRPVIVRIFLRTPFAMGVEGDVRLLARTALAYISLQWTFSSGYHACHRVLHALLGACAYYRR